MNTIVHLETVIRTVFGVVDADGNVVRQIVVSGPENKPISINVLSQDSWNSVYNGLMDAKQNVLDQFNAPGPEEEVPVIQGELVD